MNWRSGSPACAPLCRVPASAGPRGTSTLAPHLVGSIHGAREDFERRHGGIVGTDAVQQRMHQPPTVRHSPNREQHTRFDGDDLGDEAVLGLPLCGVKAACRLGAQST